jgi:hypothetical protein
MAASMRAGKQGSDQGAHAMSPACEEAFCRSIARRTGIVLQDHQLPNLRETVQSGCDRFGFNNSEEYFNSRLH